MSIKEQKNKWIALQKQAFVEDLLNARPKDYQERNAHYRLASIYLSYPLQLISIAAGSYLLFTLAQSIWQLTLQSYLGISVFIFCVSIFLGIESLRRWFVNTTGYNYFTTLKIYQGHLKKGEWLRSNLMSLGLISFILVFTGTLGVYQYIKNNRPQAPTLNVEKLISPLSQKIQEEKIYIKELDQQIQALFQSKKQELAENKNYSSWQGKDFLLPEVKERHRQYDQQIQAMQQQRQTHQNLIIQYETQLSQKEQKAENKNQKITQVNALHTEKIASITAGIWLGFEIVLIFMLAYPWIYLYQAKKEKLLESLEDISFESHPSSKFKISGFSNGKASIPKNEATSSEIGFHKWYKNLPKTSSQVIIKEVPVIKEVIRKEVTNQGFPVTCAYCGKQEIKQRPAKYCSNACRTKAWRKKKLKPHSVD